MLRSGNGTGTGTLSSLILQSPVAVASGTGAQTQTTALTINNGAVQFGAKANGQSLDFQSLTELTTIAAATTTTTTIQIPANAVVLAVSVRVTTVIPDATTFNVGDGTVVNRFNTAAIAVAANSTDPGTKTPCGYYAAATGIVLTMNGTPPAANTGRVRVTIHYYTCTPPSS